MTLIIIAICLAAERFLPELDDYRQPIWFGRYLNWSQRLPWSEWMLQSSTGVLIVLAPLLIAAGLLQEIFDGILGNTLESVFAAVVLLFCLGPKDLQRQVQSFIDALDTEDQEEIQRIGKELAADNPNDDERDIAIAIVNQAYLRTFGVIFWFILLGPLGAVLYRSCHTLKLSLTELKNLELNFSNGVNRLLYILDWIPVRITAFSYALSGNFHAATYAWWGANGEKDAGANHILSKAGKGALDLDDTALDDRDPAVDAEAAQALSLRSLTIWVGMLALITITSWLS